MITDRIAPPIAEPILATGIGYLTLMRLIVMVAGIMEEKPI